MPFILWLKYNPSAAARPCITEDSAGVEPSTCPGQSVKVMNPPVCKHTQKSSLARTTHARTHTRTQLCAVGYSLWLGGLDYAGKEAGRRL